MDDLGDRASDELVRLIEIYSPSGNEAEIADYAFDRLEGLGLAAKRIPTPGGSDNVVAGADSPHLLVTAHLDTIRPTWTWSGRAQVRDGVVHGLGAVDDKGGVAAALLALEIAAEAGVDVVGAGVTIAFTVDEEVNGTGSVAVAEALQPPLVIALEGTGLAPAIAEAGLVAGAAEVRGRSVHGSLPEFGDNAIVKAARLVLDLEAAEFTAFAHPLIGATLPCVEEIGGGSSLYVVPDSTSLRFDIRVAPGIGAERVADEVRRICERHEASVEFEEVVDAFVTPEDSPLVAALQASARRVLGASRPFVGVRAWTDAHNFVAEGSEAVVFGPGQLIGTAHHPDEHIRVVEVVAAARIIADLIGHARALGG